jgi:hypothetical protein
LTVQRGWKIPEIYRNRGINRHCPINLAVKVHGLAWCLDLKVDEPSTDGIGLKLTFCQRYSALLNNP